MPFEVRHYPEHRLGVIRYSGIVTGEDLVGALSQLVAGPWEVDFNGVADLREVTGFVLHPADTAAFRSAVGTAVVRSRGGRSAFLVRGDGGDEAARRLIREIESVPGRTRRVYYAAGAAAHWLGVPEELLEGG